MRPNLSIAATAATLLLATSCSIKENRIQCQAPVTVSVNTFSISQEDIQITKAAQNVTDIAAIKSITLAFFDESGTQIRKIDQLRDDATTYETFGTFSLSLPWGTYKMVVIAHDGENPIILNSLSEANFETEKPKDTFLYSQDLTVENSNPMNLSATLERIITRLIVESTDVKSADVQNVRITLSKGDTAFNPVTRFSYSDAGFVNTITPATATGAVTKLRTTFFIAAEEESLDVKAEVLDASGNILNTITVANVSFKRNRATFLTGECYSASESASFQAETTFLSDLKLTF